MPKLFVFAAGGTGARVTRSLAMLLASGLPSFKDYEVYPILIDGDMDNGDLRRTLDLLGYYSEINRVVSSPDHGAPKDRASEIFGTPVLSLYSCGLYSCGMPTIDLDCKGKFADYIGLDTLSDNTVATGDLIKSLYDSRTDEDSVLNHTLAFGLKSLPDIGRIATQALTQSREFDKFVKAYQTGDKVAVIGSVFGGTGASVIPVLVNAIYAKHPMADIGLVLMLPYFRPANNYGHYVDDGSLIARAKETLAYYVDCGVLDHVQKVYYVGSGSRLNTVAYAEGGDMQHNNADVTELIASLAIGHFVSGRGSQGKHYNFAVPTVPVAGAESMDLYIDDFDDETKAALGNLTRLAIALKFAEDEICSETRHSQTLFFKFLIGDKLALGSQQIKGLCGALHGFYASLHDWLAEMRNQSANRLYLCDLDKDYMEMSLKRVPYEVRRPMFSIFQSEKNREWFDAKWLNARMNENLRVPKKAGVMYAPEWLLMRILDATAADAMTVLRRRDDKLAQSTPADRGEDAPPSQSTPVGQYPGTDYIPSPFSRMYVVASALAKAKNPDAKHPAISMLVNEWLDMLEFIYLYGKSDDVKIIRWDFDKEISKLRESKNTGHQRLAAALDGAARDRKFSENRRTPIWLFKWGDMVLGGTSPVSFVYAAPNLRESLPKDFPFVSGDGCQLFTGDTPTPLHKRSKAFREYVYRLCDAYGDLLPAPVTQYIRFAGMTLDSELLDEVMINKNQPMPVVELMCQGLPVIVNGVPLMCYQPEISQYTTDYLLRPTRQVSGRIPMVLTPTGGRPGVDWEGGASSPRPAGVEPGVDWEGGASSPRKTDALRYLDIPWSYNYGALLAHADGNIHKRALPGTSVRYPYLTVSDLLEDKIITFDLLPIDAKRFYTCCKDKYSFVLPIKRRFFDYFKPEDLDDMLEIIYDFDEATDALTVNVALRLPLVNGGTITLEKVYHTDHLYDMRDDIVFYGSSDQLFNLALFPFYRLEPDLDKNVYGVMTSISGFDSRLSFRKLSDMGTIVCPYVTQSEWNDRSRSPHNLNTYYHIDGAFDFIEMECSECTGILVPRFKVVNSQGNVKDYVFGVDFGRCFTHIAYGDVSMGALGVSSVEPLEIGCPAAFLLNGYPRADYNLLKYFVPNERLVFPMISQVGYQHDYDWNSLLQKPADLFAKTNLFLSETVDLASMSFYYTSAAYITELLWLIKNKSILSGGGDRFRVMVTYPSGWDASTINELRMSWLEAKAYLKCDAEIMFCPRSEAVLAFETTMGGSHAPTLTIDASWWMTELVYRSTDQGHNFVLESLLGAQEFCGFDSMDSYKEKCSTPIFDAFSNECNRCYEEETKHFLERILENCPSYASPDNVIAYLLKHNGHKFNNTIIGNKAFYQMAVVYLCAQAYYAAYVFSRKGCAVPRHIALSGVGAVIVQGVFGSDEVLSEIFQTVFRYVGHIWSYQPLCDAEPQVSIYDRPVEVAAKGAVLAAEALDDPNCDLKALLERAYGFDGENPGEVLKCADLTSEIRESALKVFDTFLDMFSPERDETLGADLRREMKKTWTTALYYQMDPAFIKALRDKAPDALSEILHYYSKQDYLPVASLFPWILKYVLPVAGAEFYKNRFNY